MAVTYLPADVGGRTGAALESLARAARDEGYLMEANVLLLASGWPGRFLEYRGDGWREVELGLGGGGADGRAAAEEHGD